MVIIAISVGDPRRLTLYIITLVSYLHLYIIIRLNEQHSTSYTGPNYGRQCYSQS